MAQMRPRQRLALDLGPGFCREVNLTGAQTRAGKEEKWVYSETVIHWEEAVRVKRHLTLWSLFQGLFSFVSGLKERHPFTLKS